MEIRGVSRRVPCSRGVLSSLRYSAKILYELCFWASMPDKTSKRAVHGAVLELPSWELIFCTCHNYVALRSSRAPLPGVLPVRRSYFHDIIERYQCNPHLLRCIRSYIRVCIGHLCSIVCQSDSLSVVGNNRSALIHSVEQLLCKSRRHIDTSV